jgi:plasmid maintenance system antidote protein VapI
MNEPQNPESAEAIAYRLELTHAALERGTQAAFAGSIGVTPQAWTNYIKARDRMSLDTALRLCRRYSVTLDWIYRGNTYGMPAELVRRIEKVASERASKRRQASETP